MLEYIAKRTREQKNYDIQKEEIKLLNAVKMHVDSGWVVDHQTLTALLEISGIFEIKKQYDYAVEDDELVAGPNLIPILKFAYRVSCAMGVPDCIVIDNALKHPKEPGQDSWVLDARLYNAPNNMKSNSSL